MDQHRSPTRRLRIFLRDFRLVEATVNFAEGQTLASFFAHRKSYLNLREATWVGTGDRVDHAVLKIEQVLWASAADGDVPLSHASAPTAGRTIEVQLDGGLLVRARLGISQQQRLSDYLEAAGRFVPLLNAQLLRSGRPPKRVNLMLGDIVLNQEGIQAAWETDAQLAPAVEDVVTLQSETRTGPQAASAAADATTGAAASAADAPHADPSIDDAAPADTAPPEVEPAAEERRPRWW